MRARATTQSTARFDVNGAGWNDREGPALDATSKASVVSSFASSSHLLLLPTCPLFQSNRSLTGPSTHFPPGTTAYSLLAIRHAFLLSFPSIMSFLKSFPDFFFFHKRLLSKPISILIFHLLCTAPRNSSKQSRLSRVTSWCWRTTLRSWISPPCG